VSSEASRHAAPEAAVHALSAQLAAIDRGLRDHALYVVDDAGVVVWWGEAAERVHHLPTEEIVGRPMHLLVPGDAAAHVRDLLAAAAQGGWCEEEAERLRRDGTPFPAATVITAFEDGEGARRFQVLTCDLSERRRLERLAQGGLATAIDELTGVNARRAFFEVATAEIARARRYAQPLSVLLIDPDEFRALNDAHGAAFGDECLTTLAGICRQESRNTDIIGRVGGEELAVLLPSTELAGGLVLAERIRERMQRHVFAGGPNGVRCTVSVGVAELDGEVATVEALLALAETAVGRAKAAGRNLVVGLDD
jgi:diguanylate cyclase (GGDEF)-like protein/PAS domain S-box-containing protein